MTGKKPLFTGWTERVAAFKGDVLATRCFELVRTLAAQNKRSPTHGTDWALGISPCSAASGVALQGHIL